MTAVSTWAGIRLTSRPCQSTRDLTGSGSRASPCRRTTLTTSRWRFLKPSDHSLARRFPVDIAPLDAGSARQPLECRGGAAAAGLRVKAAMLQCCKSIVALGSGNRCCPRAKLSGVGVSSARCRAGGSIGWWGGAGGWTVEQWVHACACGWSGVALLPLLPPRQPTWPPAVLLPSKFGLVKISRPCVKICNSIVEP